MRILNINQFVERQEIKLELCPRCCGVMHHTGINMWDAVSVLLLQRKVTGRLKCGDCRLEMRITN